jgi:Bifunctional DNA primase/polymerase, N-terminal
LWFTYDEPVGNRAKVNDVGLDVRGVGGYVVVPPSVHPSGHVYSWEVGISWAEDDRVGMWPPAPMPLELAELLWPTRPAVSGNGKLAPLLTDHYVQAALDREVAAVRSASVGSRNDTLNRAVYAVWRFVTQGRLDEEVVVREFAYAARACGLEDQEAAATIQSAIAGRHG